MEKHTVYEGKFLRLIKEGHWEYVDRVNADGAIMVVAVTANEELVLVEEYRIPIHASTLGLPAGISGDEGEESKLYAAKRELEEEAGYMADEWKYLCEGPSSPGLTTEMVSFFQAGALRKISGGGGINNENITVHLVPISEINEWLILREKEGKIIDPKIYLGLYFLFYHKYQKALN